MLVVDASAVAELLLARPGAESVARHVAEHEYALHAPQVIDLEVLSALRRVVIAGEATRDRASESVSAFLDLPVERYAHLPLLQRVWQLRDNFSAYDAAYMALTEALGAPLLTADGRFARAARTHGDVEVLLADGAVS